MRELEIESFLQRIQPSPSPHSQITPLFRPEVFRKCEFLAERQRKLFHFPSTQLKSMQRIKTPPAKQFFLLTGVSNSPKKSVFKSPGKKKSDHEKKLVSDIRENLRILTQR